MTLSKFEMNFFETKITTISFRKKWSKRNCLFSIDFATLWCDV